MLLKAVALIHVPSTAAGIATPCTAQSLNCFIVRRQATNLIAAYHALLPTGQGGAGAA